LEDFTLAGRDHIVWVGRDASEEAQAYRFSSIALQYPVPAERYTPALGLCTNGTYKGGLKGTSIFIGSSITPTADTPTTSVVLLTGGNRIETKHGTLMTKDAIVLRTTGAGEFAEVDTIVGGTGEWVGANGQIIASGTFTAAGGEGEYSGEICMP
jgi:hypothetical protein